jgi:hypothetical protein
MKATSSKMHVFWKMVVPYLSLFESIVFHPYKLFWFFNYVTVKNIALFLSTVP